MLTDTRETSLYADNDVTYQGTVANHHKLFIVHLKFGL